MRTALCLSLASIFLRKILSTILFAVYEGHLEAFELPNIGYIINVGDYLPEEVFLQGCIRGDYAWQ